MKILTFVMGVSLPLIVCGVARAQIPVTDAGVLGTTTSIATTSGNTAASAKAINLDTDNISSDSDSIKKSTADIDAVVTQQQTGVGTMFTGDDSGSLTNTMDADQVFTNLSYQSATSTASGTKFFNQNNVDTSGADSQTDPESVALKNTLVTASNIQGMAYDNLKSLQARLAELSDMNSQLATATNITAIEAIKGRIAVESLMVQTQQAQASNLAAMASAQQEIDQQNREQAVRQEHAQTATFFAGLGG